MATFGPFIKGMDNKSADHSVPNDAVRNAVNVVFRSGKPKRRGGATKVYSGLTQGGYSCPAGAFFVDNGALYKYGAPPVELCKVHGSVFTYWYQDGIVYFSDGVVSKKIVGNIANNWGMTPPSAPTLHVTSGTYGGGQYLAALTFVDEHGTESGASSVASVNANDNCGILFTNLPSSQDPQVHAVRLYLSMPNGSELFHVADVTTDSYTITAGRYDDANVLDLLFVSPAPAGRIVRHHNGRMFVADSVGNVFYSEPFQPDHFLLADNYLSFSAPVDIMEPVSGGIFFAYGDRTDFYAGDVEAGFEVSNIFDYGAVFGTGARDEDSAMWQSQRGAVVGNPDGSAENISKHAYPDTASSGAAVLKEHDGMKHFIASLKSPSVSTLAARSFIDAEVIRRGE
jgi:hypothetical protein